MGRTMEILKRLRDGRVEFIVIGGVAATAYGSALPTYDVDICAPLDHENAKRIITALDGLNPRWRNRPDLPVIGADNHNLRGLKNMYLRTDAGILDVLGEVPEVCTYAELATDAIEANFDGTRCRIIDIDRLIAAKRVAGREKDLQTIVFLESIKKYRALNPGLFDGIDES